MNVTVVSGIQASVDVPASSATVATTFPVTGWAIDASSSSGTGVPYSHVWAFPAYGGNPIFLGQANAGGNRPDIGAYFQDSRFTPSGYGLTATLPVGDYWINVYVASSVTAGFAPPIQVFVQVR